MLDTNEFILLKALYDEDLSNAVLDKDIIRIDVILNSEKYEYEMKNGFVDYKPINIEYVHQQHTAEIKDPKLIDLLL
ncbi:hypothetical protein F4V43_02330 [Paenibacillus spiritus]|uniref:Uncharacterized protein n=1 Tax=Paenibacillus spiritus TaxID=2496557 RepID=A0A5J5GI04_9BACL|nr:hypothetical protein [Paenibacillus spiritus]KAA9007343.1 hypothetical protein F4V43_02330 [Paenibacillus spiritus]